MAKIEIEKKPKSSLLPLLLALLVIGLAAVGVWFYLQNEQAEESADIIPADSIPSANGDSISMLELQERAGVVTFLSLA
jgi:hypothetical protein